MLNAKQLTYYDWDDIQEFLCEKMGIPSDKFRDYHKIVGGEYKDFWHVWLRIVSDQVYNGFYSKVYLDADDYFQNCILKKYDWAKPLIDAIRLLAEEVKSDSIVIYYYW